MAQLSKLVLQVTSDMHPTQATELEWDDGNEGECARHGVSAVEVYQVWRNGPLYRPNKRGLAGDWMMIGRSDGGRLLTVVILARPEQKALRPITAWDASRGDRTVYRRSGRDDG